MPEKKKYLVHNHSKAYANLRTEKQWLKLGYVPDADADGIKMWTNGMHHQKAIYYAPHEVKIPTAKDYNRLKTRLQTAEEMINESRNFIADSEIPDKLKKRILNILNLDNI